MTWTAVQICEGIANDPAEFSPLGGIDSRSNFASAPPARPRCSPSPRTEAAGLWPDLSASSGSTSAAGFCRDRRGPSGSAEAAELRTILWCRKPRGGWTSSPADSQLTDGAPSIAQAGANGPASVQSIWTHYCASAWLSKFSALRQLFALSTRSLLLPTAS